MAKIKTLAVFSGETTAVEKGGDERIVSYRGTELDRVLEELDTNKDRYESIRLTADDGYSVELPADVAIRSEIILAYLLDEQEPPGGGLQSVVPGETAMYWVKDLAEIHLLADAKADPVESLIVMEDVLPLWPVEELTVFGEQERAVNIKDVLDIEDKTRVFFLATDGLAKGDYVEVEKRDYFIQLTGEEAPLFFSPELPKSMHVKNLAALMGNKRAVLFLGAFKGSQLAGKQLLSMLEGYLAEGDIVFSTSSGEMKIDKKDLRDKTLYLEDDKLFIE